MRRDVAGRSLLACQEAQTHLLESFLKLGNLTPNLVLVLGLDDRKRSLESIVERIRLPGNDKVQEAVPYGADLRAGVRELDAHEVGDPLMLPERVGVAHGALF